MTNKEYIAKSVGKFNLDQDDIDLILIEAENLNPNDEVNLKACKQALYSSFTKLIPMADITEGDMSIKWNMEAVKMYYAGLCADLGHENPYAPKKPSAKFFRPWG